MHTHLLRHVAAFPVIREVVGAASGCAIALALYGIFELGRSLIGGASLDVLAPVHAAASVVLAHGAVSLGLTCTLALAGGCAFIHTHMTSRID